MKGMRTLSIFFTLLIGSMANALMGTETHGGDVIVCYDQPLFKADGSVDPQAQMTRLEVKDYWEGSHESIYSFQPPAYSQEDFWKNIENVLFRFSQIDYALSSRLVRRVLEEGPNSFKNSISFVEQGELPEVDDASSVLNLPFGSNCYDRQIAHQKSGLGTGHKKIFISKKLFSLLNVTNQIGIIMHELLLEDYLTNGKEFSRNAKGAILTDPIRLINFLMVSNIYEDPSRYFNYLNLLRDQKLFYFDEIYFNFQQHLFKISKADFQSQFPEITATYVEKYWHLGSDDFIDIDFLNTIYRGRTQFSINPGSTLRFNLVAYSLKQATIKGPFVIQSSLFDGRTFQKLTIQNSNSANISFYKGRVITELELLKGADFYCESTDNLESESFHITTEAESSKYVLSSPEYIHPCQLISKKR